jgi:hypothetical protein
LTKSLNRLDFPASLEILRIRMTNGCITERISISVGSACQRGCWISRMPILKADWLSWINRDSRDRGFIQLQAAARNHICDRCIHSTNSLISIVHITETDWLCSICQVNGSRWISGELFDRRI